MTIPSAATKSGTQVVQRVAALLRGVSARNRIGARLIDLCTEVAIERPTAHRILQGLVSEGLIRQDESTKRYFLGSAIYEMGLAASPRTNIRDLCHPHLQQIAQATGDTVSLTARAGFDGVCIDRAEGAFPIKVFVLEVGKVNAERCREKYPNYSEANARKTIARARTRGFVISDVIELPGVRSIAVPLRDKNNVPIAGISVSTLTTRMDKARSDLALSEITKAIEQIQKHLLTAEPD